MYVNPHWDHIAFSRVSHIVTEILKYSLDIRILIERDFSPNYHKMTSTEDAQLLAPVSTPEGLQVTTKCEHETHTWHILPQLGVKSLKFARKLRKLHF